MVVHKHWAGSDRRPQPAWWLLYLMAAFVVAMVGLEEFFVAGHGLRELLEVLTVVGGFGLFGLWRRINRIALDLGRRRL